MSDPVDALNRAMVAFDFALGGIALASPRTTLRALGHGEPSPDAEALMRRCGPIWLTFAAAHATAARRSAPRDWWALAWLRATEIATDAVWATGSGFAGAGARPTAARVTLRLAGVANLGMAMAFSRRARRARRG